MKYALLDPDNVIVNVIVYDGAAPYALPAGHRLEPLENGVFCGIGWTWTPTGPQPPAEVVE